MHRLLAPLLVAACAAPEPMSDCRTEDGDPVTLMGGASIEEDTIAIPVGFGGGCKEHELVVCWPDQALAESDPPQARLEVWHDGHGDRCEAFLMREVTASLLPLRNGDSGHVVVHIGEESLDYTW